jgi:hypothetical protein
MTRQRAAYLVLMPDGRRMDTTPLHPQMIYLRSIEGTDSRG